MHSITIYKGQRRIILTNQNKTILECAIGLGPFPLGPKGLEGDGRTPEGCYFVCTRNERSKYTLFLGISYPSPLDAQSAYQNGLLTYSQLAAIDNACSNKLRPPWDTPLGGQIGIHGGGIERPDGCLADNTAGCIALRDEDIKKLWPLAQIGTPVIIKP